MINLRRATPLPQRWLIGMLVGIVVLVGLGWWMEDTFRKLFRPEGQIITVQTTDTLSTDLHICVLAPNQYQWFLPTEGDTAQWLAGQGLPDSLVWITQIKPKAPARLILVATTGLRLAPLLDIPNQLPAILPYQITSLSATHLRILAATGKEH